MRGDLVVENDSVRIDVGVVAIDHDDGEALPLEVLVQRLISISVVREDNDPLYIPRDCLSDVPGLAIVGVMRADDLEVAVALGCGAGNAHKHMEQIRVIEHMTDEGNRTALVAVALGWMGDDCSPSLLALDVVLARKLVQGLDDRYPAYAVVFGQLPLRR